MNLLQTFSSFVTKHRLQNKKTLLAVSGGLDSVVLCELSKQAGLDLAIVHCNFNLRGEESARDERFVRSLGETYGVDVFVTAFDTTAFGAEQKISVQEAARNLRYGWFEEIRRENGFAYTLLAHHADDNVETLLINFFRGSGLEGLTGMPEEKRQAHCLRPMLPMRRKEIEAFAQENKLQWVEDSSNASGKYTRNFFRNELLPGLRKVFPQVDENLLNNIHRFQQTNALYAEMLQDIKRKLCETKGEELHIPVLKLMKYRRTSLLYEIIKDFGFGESAVNEVVKLAEAGSGKYIANENYRIIRHRAWFIIAPKAATAQTIIVEKEDTLVRFGTEKLTIKFTNRKHLSPDPSPGAAQLDAKTIAFPLVLRKWKAGDYFYPLGMKKKKKLARFFIDQKLSKTDKEKVWVLESHKRIVWVVGHRIDDRFKLTDSTKEVLQIRAV